MSKARKQFNTLISQLGAARALLAEWQETLPILLNKADHEYAPLWDSQFDSLRQLVLLLDDMHGHPALDQRERDKLSSFIADRTADLLDDVDDAQLAEIYKRHRGADCAAEEAERNAQIEQIMAALVRTGFKGDIDTSSPSALLQTLLSHFEEHENTLQTTPAQQNPAAHSGQAKLPQDQTRPRRAAELARERCQAAEAERLQGVMRELLRKLASQLHPEREPDAAERQRKTALMERANVAYAANDMLALLALQLEATQIDGASLATLSAARINQHNKVLREQLSELGNEAIAFQETAGIAMDVDFLDFTTPAAMMRMLDSDIAEMRTEIAGVQQRLQAWRDVTALKAWLRTRPPP